MGMTSEEFEAQSGRFKIKHNLELGNYCIYDTKHNVIVGEDGGEPEDQLLVRDWVWVCDSLNALCSEIDSEGAKQFSRGYMAAVEMAIGECVEDGFGDETAPEAIERIRHAIDNNASHPRRRSRAERDLAKLEEIK